MINMDYKKTVIAENNPKKRSHWIIASGLLAGLSLTTLWVTASSPVPSNEEQLAAQMQNHFSLRIPAAFDTSPDTRQEVASSSQWYQYTIQDGDTFASIGDHAGAHPTDIHEFVYSNKQNKKILTRLVPGQFIAMKVDDKKSLKAVVYQLNDLETFRLEKDGNGELVASTIEREYDRHPRSTQAIINNSLFEDGLQAGMSEGVIMDLAFIFGWDIDFALDIRQGDSFHLIYEELYLDGKKVKDGPILAAEFVNQGRSYQAVRFTDEKGNTEFYSPDGKSMRKAFLRTPVDFTRISSRYGNRFHPTLQRKRKHTGVDYAAPRGTPIKAAGDGRIVHKGRKGGYGKTIIIDHGNGYSTLYAHMNNFNLKSRWGSRVKQGQIIGYVGSTGRSTGPHLHYEFRVGGHHRNPLTVRLPDAAPIPKRYREEFELVTRPLLAQLELVKSSIRVAQNDL